MRINRDVNHRVKDTYIRIDQSERVGHHRIVLQRDRRVDEKSGIRQHTHPRTLQQHDVNAGAIQDSEGQILRVTGHHVGEMGIKNGVMRRMKMENRRFRMTAVRINGRDGIAPRIADGNRRRSAPCAPMVIQRLYLGMGS